MAELTDADTSPVIKNGPSTHLDNFAEVITNVSESTQVIFNNVPGRDLRCNYTLTSAIKPQSRDWIGVFKVGCTSTRQYRAFEWVPTPTQLTDSDDERTQDITFKACYLPKDEDGEHYQLFYIDSAGKMRGASTIFQFLEQSAEDFVQVPDDSMDIYVIKNKSEYCVVELKRVQEEKHEVEEKCKSLEEKVIGLKTKLQEAKDQLDSITQEYESMEEKLESMTCELTEARERVAKLSEEASNYESSLQLTMCTLMEVVDRELALQNKLDDLEKRHIQVMSDRTSLKLAMETSLREENKELKRQVEELRLQMGAEEHKKLEAKLPITESGEDNGSMRDIQTLEVVGKSQSSQVSSDQTSQGVQATISQASQGSQITNQASQAIQATTGIQGSNLSTQAIQATINQATQGSQVIGTNEEKSTQSGLPVLAMKMEGALQRPASHDDTFDLKAMQEQMYSLSKELDEGKKALDSFKHMCQVGSKREIVWKLKYRSLESENKKLRENYNKIRNDYTNMKHSYESLKFKMDFQRRAAHRMKNGGTPPLNDLYGNPYTAVERGSPFAPIIEAHRPKKCIIQTATGTQCSGDAESFIDDLDLCPEHYQMIMSP